jgi:chromosomal replication initiation ATPase DnaA
MSEPYRVPVTDADRTRAGLALQIVALVTGVPAEAMTRRERLNPRACRARWTAMYLSHVSYGWPLERVGHVFGLNRATAGIACRWVEDERDRPAFDALLDRMEAVLRGLIETPRFELTPERRMSA